MKDPLASILLRAAYAGHEFPVSVADMEGGHDHVEHTAYLRPGADLEPTGRAAYKGSLKIPFFTTVRGYGTLFPDGLEVFLATLEMNPIGSLTHPFFGTFDALMKSWKLTFDANIRNGAWLTVSFIEQNAEAIAALGAPQNRTTDATTATTQQAAATDAALADAGIAATVSGAIGDALDVLQTGLATFLVMQAQINGMLARVNAILAFPALATATVTSFVNMHTAVVALETLRVNIYQLRAQYLPQLARQRIYIPLRMMTAAEVAVVVYNDVSQAGAIRAVNGLVDLEIAAGTPLVILPLAA